MITECQIWRGAYPLLYGDDLREWTTKEEDPFSPAIHLDAAQLKTTAPEVVRAFADDGGFFGGVRTIIVHAAQGWTADDFKDIAKALKTADTSFRVSFIFESGKVPKAVTDIATSDEADYQVPKEKELRNLPKWLEERFKKINVSVDRGTLNKLVDHLGGDTNGTVDVVVSMRRYSGQKVTWAQIEPHLDEKGAVKAYNLVKAISAGDMNKALDLLARLQNAKTSEHYLIKVLSGTYEQYLVLVDSKRPMKELAEITGKNEWALKQSVAEARTLGQQRAIKSFIMVCEVERDIKGGRTVVAADAMRMLVVRLTRMFELAKR